MNKPNQLLGKPWTDRTNFARNLAVVIGIDRYEDKNIHDLSTPVSDANAFADLLETEYEYKPENVLRLINEKATLEELHTLLTEKLPNELKPTDKDRLIFYFAGHGLPKNSDEGPTGYLVPQDAKLGQECSFLPMSDVYKALNQLQCHHLLVVLDCCFAGTFRWANSRKLIAELETIRREHYDRFIRHPAWQVITSSAHDQEALDFVKLSEDRRGNPIQVNNEQHSPFALALLEALQEGEADSQGKRYQKADFTKDGVITAHELFVYLSDRVSQLAKERQAPGLYPLKREYDKGEFIFVKPGFDPLDPEHGLKPAPELNEENNPYRGLKSFEERHAKFFFGRQKLVEELSDRLGKSHRPLTVVLGTSGSGKSSLVKAGLVPYLRQKEEKDKDKSAQRWYILDPIRPGKSPFAELARAFLPVANSNLIARLAEVSFMDRRFAEILDPESKQEAASQNLTGSGDREQPSSDNGDKSFDATKLAERWNKATSEAKLLLVLDYFEQLQDFFHLQSEEQAQLSSLHDEINNTLKPLTKNLQHEPESFIGLMTAWSQNHPKTKLLLVIDQFEELITMSQDDRENGKQSDSQEQDRQKQWQRFLTLLRMTLARYRRQLHVIVTLRSDFEPRFLNSALKAHWKDARFPVRAMNSDELRDVIEGPALKQALYFEPPELVGKLIDEVGQMPGALPLLSFTLSELYIKLFDRWMKDRSTDRALRIEEYEKLGGVSGALTRRATEEYDDLVRDFGEASGKAYQATMRRMMLRMVTLGGGGVARRRVPESELKYSSREEDERVTLAIERLVKARLLVRGQEVEEPYVEPAHDFLVRGWDKLQSWIKEEQENLVLQQRLTPQVSDWCKAIIATVDSEEDKQVIGFLWNNDPRLEQLKQVFEAPQEKNWLNRQEKAFVSSSLQRKQVIEEDLRQQLKRERRLRVTAELREQTARIENLLKTNPQEALELAIQSFEQNLQYQEEKTLDHLLVPVQTGLNRAMEAVRLPNSFMGHDEAVMSVIFSPDNKMIASASQDSTVRLWDLEGNPLKDTLVVRQGVNSIAFSPDGNLLIGGGRNGILYLWRVHDFSIVQSFEGHQNPITSVAFSPNGKFIVSGSEDNTLCLWKLEEEFTKQIFQGHVGKITSVAFSPDSKHIISGSRDNTVRLWGLDGTLIITLQHNWVSSVAFSPDGKHIASSSDYSPSYYKVHLWDLQGSLISQLFGGHEGNVNSVAFSPDGQLVLVGGMYSVRGSSEILLSDLRGNSVDQHFQALARDVTDGEVFSVAFSSDGKWIVCGCKDGRVCLWDMQDSSFDQLLPSQNGRIVSLTFNPSSTRLIANSKDSIGGLAQLWSLEGSLAAPLLRENSDRIYSATFSPNDEWIAYGGYGSVQLCDAHGNFIKPAFNGHSGAVNSVTFSPSSELIVSSSHHDRTICLWNLQGKLISSVIKGFGATSVTFSPDGKLIVGRGYSEARLWTLDGEPFGQSSDTGSIKCIKLSSVAFSADGKWIATGCEDGKIRLWNMEGEPVWESFEEQDDGLGKLLEVKLIAISLDGELIASSKIGRTHLWNIAGKLLKPLETSSYLESLLTFSPDSKLIAGISHDGLALGISRVHLWDLNGNRLDQSFQEYGDWLDSIAFSPDSKLIACGGKSVRLWSRDRTPICKPFKGHEGRVSTVAFSPDGRLVASGDSSGVVRLWKSSWQSWLKVCCDRLAFHLSSEDPEVDIQHKFSSTCIRYTWTKTGIARILLRQANDLSRQGKMKEARVKFKQALHNVILACDEVSQEASQQLVPAGISSQLPVTIPKSSKEEIKAILALFMRILLNPDEKQYQLESTAIRAYWHLWRKTFRFKQNLFMPEELEIIFAPPK